MIKTSLRLLRTALPALLSLALPLGAAEQTQEPPRLVVLVSLDQFRADYLDRFKPWFSETGFNRLLREGTRYMDCRQRHALTATAPGHAAIATGTYACDHGIVANEWAIEHGGRIINAVDDSATNRVGPLAPKAPSCSPVNLLCQTVGDKLKEVRGKAAKVVSMANKDRAAILMGGKKPDAVFWIEEAAFVSSSYYMSKLPPWAEAFNAEGRIDKDFGRVWERLFPAADYDKAQGPDNAPGEEMRLGFGNSFPHQVNGGEPTPGKSFHDAHRLTPFSSDLLTDFAIASLEGEHLGEDKIPDLLCLGYSQTDYCGHSFGPDSHEIMDSVVRLDRSLSRLFKVLDQKVGSSSWALVLCSDHGVAPLPERYNSTHSNAVAGRFDQAGLEKLINTTLDTRYGSSNKGLPWVTRSAHGYVLRMEAIPPDLERQKVLNSLGEVLKSWPQFCAVFSREEIMDESTEENDFIRRVRLGYNRERSQDFVFVFKPFIVDRSPAGTNHGSPYPCDDHIPLLVRGAELQVKEVVTPVGAESIAPTVCALLGIEAPSKARGQNLLKR